jgi:hypothetical protein
MIIMNKNHKSHTLQQPYRQTHTARGTSAPLLPQRRNIRKIHSSSLFGGLASRGQDGLAPISAGADVRRDAGDGAKSGEEDGGEEH